MSTISILIVDDNDADRYLLNRYIEDTGLNTIVSEQDDGEAALETLRNWHTHTDKDITPPQLIFMDINMPLMDGWEFLDEFSDIRETSQLEPCSIIMCSSSENDDDLERMKTYSYVKDYIVKGKVDIQDLKNKIETATSSYT